MTKTKKDAPVDRWQVVAVIFFILGVGTLLPWNFFVTASEYFHRRLNTTEWSNGTVTVRKEYYFNNWMTLLSQLPLLLFTLLNSFLYPLISEKLRIAGSLVFILALFLLTTILVKVHMEQDTFFSVTMATVWFINSFGAVMQGSLFGLVGLLPRKYSTVFMSGQGLAGTFAALAMLFTIASGADKDSAALGYFITPCVGTLIALFSYILLQRLEFARFYFDKTNEVEHTEEPLMTDIGLVENGNVNGLANGSVASTSDLSAAGNPKDGVPKQALLTLQQVNVNNMDKSSVKEVFKKIWVMAFCVTFTFTVTLSVFPAVTVDVKTSVPGNWELYFTAVCCFLAFNVMDWLGRTITSFVQWPRKESILFPAFVVARVIFIPLLMLCNVQSRFYLPVLIHHDAVFIIIMLLFSLSSGYCVCLSMSYAPQLVEPKDGETAGALMTFFLALGLSLGAAISFPLRALV